jgi:fucose 4-O-acetylase-like acetyltransferase
MALVVVGHAIEPFIHADRAAKAGYLAIYMFHMPLFAFVSGLFARTTREPGWVARLVTRLLVPYLIFQALFLVGDATVGTKGSESVFTPYFVLWFMVSLFVWSLALPFVARARAALPLAFAVALAAGYVGSIGPVLAASRTLVFFPFFLLGHHVGPARVRAIAGRWRAIALPALVAVIGAAYAIAPRLDERWLHGNRSYPVLDAGIAGAAARVAVFATAILVAIAAMAIVPATRTRFSGLGARTITAYLLHGFVIRGASVAGVFDGPDGPVVSLGAAIIAVLVACLLMSEPVSRLARPLTEPAWLWWGRRRAEVATNA